MLRRLSEFTRHAANSSDPSHIVVTKFLFNIQRNVVSGSFICGGKIANSADKTIKPIANGDWEAEYGDKLSLVVDMITNGDGKYQEKQGKIIIRKRKETYSDENRVYDGIGVIRIPLHDIAVMNDPQTIDAHTLQEGQGQGSGRKDAVVNMTISAKAISQHEVFSESPDDSSLGASDWSDDEFGVAIAADFRKPASPDSAAWLHVPTPDAVLRSISGNSIDMDKTKTMSSKASRYTDGEYEELLSSHVALQEHCQLQEVRIQQLEANILEMIGTLRLQGAEEEEGSEVRVVEFSALQRELEAAKKELWKERLRSDAIKSANKRADEAMGIALANEKEKSSQLEEEYIAATAKIKKLEDINKLMRGELAANAAIFSSPGRELLTRRLEEVQRPPSTPCSPSIKQESPLSTESSDDSVQEGSAVQELITCKMLLARMASELQEEQHIVSVLSAQNQKYAMRLASLEVEAATNAEELEDIKQSWTPPRRSSIFNRRQSHLTDPEHDGQGRTRSDEVT